MVVDFPTPGTPVMPDVQRRARPWSRARAGHQLQQQALGLFAVIGSGRLHQGDGPRQRRAITRADGLCQSGDVGSVGHQDRS